MLTRIVVALCLVAAVPAFATVDEQRRLANQPSAAVRDAEHRSDLRITIWYPAKAGTPTRSIDFPSDQPLFRVGEVALDAPFSDEARHPLVLVGVAGFASALIAAGLVDEFQLYINPVALGGGTRIFDQAGFRKLRLLGSKAYECDIVVNRYAPAA